MTRTDLEVIADVFRKSRPPNDPVEMMVWNSIVDQMAERFLLLNPRFKKEKFFAACGREK